MYEYANLKTDEILQKKFFRNYKGRKLLPTEKRYVNLIHFFLEFFWKKILLQLSPRFWTQHEIVRLSTTILIWSQTRTKRHNKKASSINLSRLRVGLSHILKTREPVLKMNKRRIMFFWHRGSYSFTR